jgi:peroxiredoxin Q/BCP
MLNVGDKAPDFSLPDQDGVIFSLSDLKDKANVVIYFYPKDDTPGCTAESCSFRDNLSTFNAHNTKIVGISTDSVESHKLFAKKHQLPFTLLSDKHKTVQKLYGVRNFFGLMPGRATFIIDRSGIIRFVFSSHIDIQRHVDDSLKILQELR